MEEWNLISDDQNISGKYFRFDVSLLQIIAVCDDIYIFVVVVAYLDFCASFMVHGGRASSSETRNSFV